LLERPRGARLPSALEGGKLVHNTDGMMMEIVASRLVVDLERVGFFVRRRADAYRRCGF
jgi:hypothetical protein